MFQNGIRNANTWLVELHKTSTQIADTIFHRFPAICQLKPYPYTLFCRKWLTIHLFGVMVIDSLVAFQWVYVHMNSVLQVLFQIYIIGKKYQYNTIRLWISYPIIGKSIGYCWGWLIIGQCMQQPIVQLDHMTTQF